MKIKRIMSILLAMLILCMNVVFATDTGGNELVDKAWEVTNAILWVGYAVALGMVVYIGIKYITGAADAKANMKSAIVKYLIGAFLVFSATTIARVAFNMVAGNNSTSGLAESIIDKATKEAGL